MISVISIFEKSIIKYLNHIHTEKLIEAENNKNNDDNRSNNSIQNLKEEKNKNKNNLPPGFRGIILFFIWTTKAIILRPEIKNSKKTFSWSEIFFSLNFSMLTKNILTVLEEIRKLNFSTENSDVLFSSEEHSGEFSMISEYYGENMNILSSTHFYLFPKINSNSHGIFLNNISPLWQQRMFCKLFLPLLNCLKETNNYSTENNIENNIEINMNFDKKDSDNDDNNNHSNNIQNNQDKKINSNKNLQNAPHTGCLLGLLNLTKTASVKSILPYTSVLTSVVVRALVSATKYPNYG